MGKSAPGYALCGFPHAILNRLLTLQGKNGGAHNSHCATLHTSRHHDGRLKSLGKIQRASLGTFKRAPTVREVIVPRTLRPEPMRPVRVSTAATLPLSSKAANTQPTGCVQ